MTNFKATLSGLPVICAANNLKRWVKFHDDAINDHNRFYYLNIMCSRWANIRFESMTCIAILFVGIYVIVADGISAGVAGASLMNIMLITRTLTTVSSLLLFFLILFPPERMFLPNTQRIPIS